MRLAYLGPAGTFSEAALLEALQSAQAAGLAGAAALLDATRVPRATIYETVMAVQSGQAELALVPIENSTEGSVDVTLDTLASEASDVRIVGERVIEVHQSLIARAPITLSEITTVASHPQAEGQCAAFLRTQLPQAHVVAASSTADAVRMVAEATEPGWAALGPRLAAETYGCVVLRDAVEDLAGNETRFVWLARADDSGAGDSGADDSGAGDSGADDSGAGDSGADDSGAGAGAMPARLAAPDAEPDYKTSLVFWGSGDERPGWLVRCLDEFARREVNLTRIESRPRRQTLGRYMFFLDLEGRLRDGDGDRVGEAVRGLRARCAEVRVLGSYPTGGYPAPIYG